MDCLPNCRLCLTVVPNPATAATVYSELSDGIQLAEHLDNLFDILVGDYSDADALKLLCMQCVAKIAKCASKQVTEQEQEAIRQQFRNMEGKVLNFVRSGKVLPPNNAANLNNSAAAATSAFGLNTPKAAPRPKSASTGKKRPAPQDNITLEHLLSQPASTSGGSASHRNQKKIVVREIHIDQEGDSEDEQETVVKTKCPFCAKTYVRHTALVQHVGNIHPEQQVKFKRCDTCSRNFLNAAELKSHKCPKKRSGGGGYRWGGWYRRRSWWW